MHDESNGTIACGIREMGLCDLSDSSNTYNMKFKKKNNTKVEIKIKEKDLKKKNNLFLGQPMK